MGRINPLTSQEGTTVKQKVTKTPSNSRKPWTPAQNKQLQQLAKGNTPTRVIALKMGRTPSAVQNQAGNLGISLKPTNQSPYGTQKR